MKLLDRLLTLIILPVIIIIVLSIALLFNLSKKRIEYLIESDFVHLSSYINSEIRMIFEQKIELTSILASDQNYYDYIKKYINKEIDEKYIEEFNSNINTRSKFIKDIYSMDLLKLNGDVVMSLSLENIGRNYSSNSIFKSAVSKPMEVIFSNYDIRNMKDKQDRDNILFTFAKSVVSNQTGLAIGVIIISLNASNIVKNHFKNIKPFGNGYIFLSTEENNLIYHPDKKISRPNVSGFDLWKNKGSGFIKYMDYLGVKSLKYVSYEPLSKIMVGINAHQKDIVDSYINLITIYILIATGILIPFFIYLKALFEIIFKNIKKSKKYINLIKNGDLDKIVLKKKKTENDEIAQVVYDLYSLKDELSSFFLLLNNASRQFTLNSSSIKKSVDSISRNEIKLESNINKINLSIINISNNLSSFEEKSKSSKEIFSDTLDIVKKGDVAIEENIVLIKEIANKINAIQDIATNTNLISLNASIEASRAGINGRGFSIVATEIGKLADISSQITDQINELSQKIVSSSESAGGFIKSSIPNIQKCSDTINEIINICEKEAEIMTELKKYSNSLANMKSVNKDGVENILVISKKIESRALMLNGLLGLYTVPKDTLVIQKHKNIGVNKFNKTQAETKPENSKDKTVKNNDKNKKSFLTNIFKRNKDK